MKELLHDRRGAKLALITAALAMVAPPLGAKTCAELVTLKLPETTITSAQEVPAGSFVAPPTPDMRGESIHDLPAFCRVTAEIKPTADSNIKLEVWMPLTNWSGRYEGIGNGGFAGSISYLGLAGALRQGSAAASTDTGHSASALMRPGRLGIRKRLLISVIARFMR